MIAKKNPRYNLEGKRIAVFSLGLLTTTAATLAAFTYQSPYEHELEKQKIPSVPIEYMTEDKDPIIKPKDEIVQPLVQPQQQSDPSQSAAVSTSVDISQDIVATDSRPELPDPGVLGMPDVVIVNDGGGIVNDEPIQFPKYDAKFIGGYEKMQEFIVENTIYPDEDLQIGNQGVVYVSFIVERDGSVSNVVITKGVSTNIDREAKRVVKKFPNWIPAENEGEKVRTIVQLPIRFIPE